MDHHGSTGSISLFCCGADERKVLMAVLESNEARGHISWPAKGFWHD
jgi:hypothetical protein